MAFTQTTLTESPLMIYQADRTVAVTVLYLTNNNSSAVTASVYLVHSGDSASDSTILYKDLNLDTAATAAVLTERIILESGDSVWAVSSAAASVVATVCSIAV